MAFSTFTENNDIQRLLVSILLGVLKDSVSKEDLIEELKEKVAPQVFVSKEVQENYDIYRTLCAELVKKGYWWAGNWCDRTTDIQKNNIHNMER